MLIRPGPNGFGIDLADSNGVAGIVPGGAAANSDLKVGDVIVAVNGINLGTKRLADVMPRGQQAYTFNVIRASAPGPMDQVRVSASRGSPMRSLPAHCPACAPL